MKLLDANELDQKRIETDICIIGGGPAGITLALKLKNSGLDVVIAESGGVTNSERANEMNTLKIQSNFTYRNGDSERNRQVGGTANLWTGRVVPFLFDKKLDEQWKGLKENVIPFYDDAFRVFGIDPFIQKKDANSDNELYAYWADKTERFNYRSNLIKENSRVRIFHNLNCIGEPTFENKRVRRIGFLNKNGERIEIQAANFVFAMGAIENSRMLLIIKKNLPADHQKKLQNTGRYIMDHPRVWHGDVTKRSAVSEVSRFQIKRTEVGFYKTGIRNKPTSNRVYCNLMRVRGHLNRIIDFIPSESFDYSFRKLLIRERGILQGFTNEILKLPAVNSLETIGNSLQSFFNNDSSERFNLMTYCEQRPRYENHISLTKEEDQNGLPIPLLENRIHEEELQEVVDFFEYLKRFLGNMDCQLEYNPEHISNPVHYTDAAHPMGGTRYSNDQERRVIEKDLSVVGIPNLFITGSSVFPTSSVENPTHLIVALSCYLAEVLSKKGN